jgi:transposase
VQQAMLNRTFGCVRVVWNRALAERQRRWQRDHQGTTYAETDAALTALAVDAQPPEPLPAAGRAVGVDLGVHDFAVTSDGGRVANPRHLQRRARNLARYQRRLARCRKGSANRAKARVARAHRKVRNARHDFLHKTTTGLVPSGAIGRETGTPAGDGWNPRPSWRGIVKASLAGVAWAPR